jgi:hypothetical protein
MLKSRVEDYASNFQRLFTVSEEQDIVKELQQKFKMPLEEVLARRKREAYEAARKRRMTMAGMSPMTMNKIKIALQRASVEVRDE